MTLRDDAEATGFVSTNEGHIVTAVQGNEWSSKQSDTQLMDEKSRFRAASLLDRRSLGSEEQLGDPVSARRLPLQRSWISPEARRRS